MVQTRKKRRKTVRPFVATALFIVFGFITFAGIFFNLFEPLELKLLDLRFRFMNPEKSVTDDIVFIDIDEESLQTLSPEIGGWPWPRGGILAQNIVEYVMQGDPAVFLFDILFVDYSPKSPDVDIPYEDDILLGTSIIYPQVSHAMMFENLTDGRERAVPDSAAVNFQISVDDTFSSLKLPSYSAAVFPFSPLDEFAGQLHSVDHIEDTDGISRRVKLLTKFNGSYYPSLTLRAVKQKLGIDSFIIDEDKLVFSDSSGKKHEVPLDQEGNLLINFYKDLDKFTLYPADQIIASSQNYFSDQGALIVAPDTFRNKIVIIGSSAVGLKDLKVTPMGKNIPGPYLHINAISTILNDQLLKTVPRSGMILICLFVLFPIIGLMFFLNRHSAGYSLGAILVLLSIAAPLLLFRFQGLILNFSALLASGLIPYFASLAYLSFSETKEKE